jgi:hypothetical protein
VLCSAAWSNERWPVFGVEEFPDIDAEQRHAQLLTELDGGRYIDSRTALGTQALSGVDDADVAPLLGHDQRAARYRLLRTHDQCCPNSSLAFVD